MKAYLIPGLGFDHRIFRNLEFKNIKFEFLNWIEPEKDEHIKSYANRLSEPIPKSSDEVILIGHSLGGIMAQEIAELMPIKKIVLISSIKSRKELPLHFKTVNPIKIHQLFSKSLTEKTIRYWGKYHDYETPEEQELVVEMVNNQSDYCLQWSLKQLSIWDLQKANSETEIIQIHGTLDKTFPIKLIQQPFKTIQDAGHFMVYKESKLLNDILDLELRKKLV